MPQSVTVAEAQDQMLETALDLYRIRQRLHNRFKRLKSEHESLREYYDTDTDPRDEVHPLELEVAEAIDIATDTLEDVADRLRKTSRLTEARIQLEWSVEQKQRLEGGLRHH